MPVKIIYGLMSWDFFFPLGDYTSAPLAGIKSALGMNKSLKFNFLSIPFTLSAVSFRVAC